jgi:hypothetical protein
MLYVPESEKFPEMTKGYSVTVKQLVRIWIFLWNVGHGTFSATLPLRGASFH